MRIDAIRELGSDIVCDLRISGRISAKICVVHFRKEIGAAVLEDTKRIVDLT